jgi:hypothetical protein
MSRTGNKKTFIDYELPAKALDSVRGGNGVGTTEAVGEEGGGAVTTYAAGEEGCFVTTEAVGEEGGCSK